MISEIFKIYDEIKDKIIERLNEFSKIWKEATEEELFRELSFCLLTPQSKARVCWLAVNRLVEKNLLMSDNVSLISKEIKDVRFRNNKARYINEAKNFFFYDNRFHIREKILTKGNNVKEIREYFVSNVKGMAYKEASHFLRNIGFFSDIAILDRHILRNMIKLDIIKEIPTNIFSSKTKYIETEEKLKNFANSINIELSHLDFVLWYKETSDIFK